MRERSSPADDSPVQGLKLAYIGDPITYLLYAGRWFPMVGYGTNRFTAIISVSVPAGYTVIGSGKQSAGPGAAKPRKAQPRVARAVRKAALNRLAIPAGGQTVTFTYEDRPSFPGTILIGKYVETKSTEGGLEHQRVHNAGTQGGGRTIRRYGRERILLLHDDLRAAVRSETERGGIAERHRAIGMGSGDCRACRASLHGKGRLPPAGEHASRISGSEPW